MDSEDLNILTAPDDAGWYFYKKERKSKIIVVYVNEDGIGFSMNEDGDSFELDDLIGRWEPAEPRLI